MGQVRADHILHARLGRRQLFRCQGTDTTMDHGPAGYHIGFAKGGTAVAGGVVADRRAALDSPRIEGQSVLAPDLLVKRGQNASRLIDGTGAHGVTEYRGGMGLPARCLQYPTAGAAPGDGGPVGALGGDGALKTQGDVGPASRRHQILSGHGQGATGFFLVAGVGNGDR